MAEGSGLLNRRTGNTVPGVQIPPSPPETYLQVPEFLQSSGIFFTELPKGLPLFTTFGVVLLPVYYGFFSARNKERK